MTNSNTNAAEKDQKVGMVKTTTAAQPIQSDQVEENAQETPPASVTTIKACAPSYSSRHCRHSEGPNIADSLQSPLLALPQEIRDNIYTMVVDDMPDTIDLDYRSLVQSNLCQPELAKVNRQFRDEVLPIFYDSKHFVIRIQPETYSHMNPLWRKVSDRFFALEAGVEGHSHLSRIRRLDVELWDKHLKRYSNCGFIPTSASGREDYNFCMRVTCGIYLQFGPDTGPGRHRSQGRSMLRNDQVNFSTREAVRDWLQSGIASERRVHDPHQIQTSFWPSLPLERLLDLAMMIGTKCEVPGRQLRLGTCFVDLGWVGNDVSFGPFIWQRH